MDSKLFILPTHGNKMQPIYTNTVFLLQNKLSCEDSSRVAAVNCSSKGLYPQSQHKRVKFTDNSVDIVGIGQIPLDKVTKFTSLYIFVFYSNSHIIEISFYTNSNVHTVNISIV